jgi:(1->4)-alpha-D-glucan 1-alpha-D-glucosylmutase
MLKAIREAKQTTSWINRNTEYEAAVSSFVKALLDPGPKNRFLKEFLPFQRRVARMGLWNSLSQTLLKLTSPGVPDIYQGNELWDLSLVDPDNRRPVDYGRREHSFNSLRNWGSAPDAASLKHLLETPEDGRMKMYLIWKTLCFRQQHPDLFQQGEYLPLEVAGAKADRVIAFARKYQGLTAIVIVPRLITGLINEVVSADSRASGENDPAPLGPQVWGDTQVLLPDDAVEKYCNVFTGEVFDFDRRINVSQALGNFPIALGAREQ